MEPPINHAAFIAMLSEQLPEVAAEIDDCSAGLLHPEMATVARCTVAAAKSGAWEAVRRHLAFVEQVLRSADDDAENAVYLSFVEKLPVWDGDDCSPELEAMLPDGLAQVLWEMKGNEFAWPPIPRPGGQRDV